MFSAHVLTIRHGKSILFLIFDLYRYKLWNLTLTSIELGSRRYLFVQVCWHIWKRSAIIRLLILLSISKRSAVDTWPEGENPFHKNKLIFFLTCHMCCDEPPEFVCMIIPYLLVRKMTLT
jgi:hypothetical protein